MNRFFTTHRARGVALIAALYALAVASFAQDKDWRPVTTPELQLKASSVEPGADAEVIFWEVRVDDEAFDRMVMKHWIRVKIFTEKGREKYSKVDIPYGSDLKIKDIKARVIKADGSIVEIAKADVFEREIARQDKVKIKAKSFAVPNIEPGVIVEYKYQEVYNYGSANNMRMKFQHDVPIQKISYYFRPANDVRYLTFNMAGNKFVKDKDNYYRATLENVKAITQEAFMPPEDEVRSWLLLYYTDDKKGDAMDFWSRAGGYIVRVFDVKDTLKPGKEIKAAATQIVAGVTAPDDQIAKIFEFCKTKIKNITFDPSLTEDEKKEIKQNKSTNDTYKKLQGTDVDINELFASLTSSLGLETRLAFGGDRSEKFFNPLEAHTSFIHFSAVAVKLNGSWKYYAPGDKFVPYGLLEWKEEDTAVLLLSQKDFMTTKTPYSTPEKSEARRTGKFKLSDDGTLEGTVRVEYTGHLANQYKLDNYKDSDNKREETLKEEVKETMSTAEVTAISVSNLTDPEKPFVYEYKLRVPNYAQKTGKRIFLHPGVFTYGTNAAFSAATRKYDIFFHHPWAERDEIEIELPKGYELENPDVPNSITDTSGIASHSIDMTIDKASNKITYGRRFSFGAGGKVLFDAQVYQPLRNLFDAFHKSDTHSVVLRQK